MNVTLNFRNFSEELPVIGSEIHLIDIKNSIYNFTELFSRRIEFSFNCGDFGFDTEQEALEAGIELTLDSNEAVDADHNFIKMCPLEIESVEGCLWIYSWEVEWKLMKCFPFQTKAEWNIAAEQKWITDIEYTSDEIVIHPNHNKEIHYSYRKCKMDGIGFTVTFCDDAILDWDFD